MAYGRLVASIALFVSSMLLNVASGQIAYHNRVVNPQLHELKDALLDVLPLVNSSLWPDIMIYTSFGLMVILPLCHKHMLRMYENYFFLLGFCLLVRAIIVPFTDLPDPFPGCAGPDPEGGKFFQQCGSLMFSGHTTFILAAAIVYTHDNRYHPIITICCVLYSFAAILGVLVCRLHWTMDVLVATGFDVSVAIAYYNTLALTHKQANTEEELESLV